MEQLVGSNIQVVLSLKEGKGFERIANPTCIVASLNGHSLETDITEPEYNPQYVTDLMWKADKNGLRKMRSAQEPLKIECFEVKENGKRDKIGYVILSLRQARIVVPREADIRISPTWHKLLGLRNDVKASKPELSLTLTIEEHETYVRRISKREEEPIVEKTPSNISAPFGNSTVPYLVEEECLIQLGSAATCRTLFLLNITSGTAQNLHILNEDTDEKSANNYSLWYRILENDMRLKSFGSLEKRCCLNEKLVIKIRSSLDVLRNYLWEQPNLLLLLQYKDTIRAHSEVDLRPLVPVELTQEMLNEENGGTVLDHRCTLISQKTPNIIDDNEKNQAFLDLQLNLCCLGSKKLAEEIGNSANVDQSNQRTKPIIEYSRNDERNLHHAFSEIDAHRNPCGDTGKCLNGDRRKIICKNYQNSNQNDRATLSRGFLTTSNSCNGQNHAKSVEAYHCYCLSINLIGIKLKSPINDIEFRFHHPKAKIMSTLYPKMPLLREEKLRLQDIGCKLHFISAADEIRHLLSSFPPKVSVCDAANEAKAFIGQTILDVSLLFNQNKLKSEYEAFLYGSDQNVIGVVDVAMYLEDHGPYYKTCKRTSGENLGPPIIDDSLAYKIVEELECWKERQQEIFRVELKKREERHLNRLSEEWQKRRENLESKLACSVEQCKMLANSLNKATEDLRTRRLMSLEKEARLKKANEDLQWRYDNNVLELQEASRRMQEELVTKVNILEEERNNLDAKFEALRLENEQLRRLTTKQAEDLETYQKGSLTQDQTASLLQDVKALEQKLESTQTSKSFFKAEWGKAVREIHRMKMEHQQAIEVQIKTSKEELKNFDLEDVLCADSNALSNDQIALGQIQKEIDVIKPRPSFLNKDSTSQQIFGPIDNLYTQHSSKTHRSSTKSEEQDERLRNLIEERNQLLKTGSYEMDDAIIVKLNTEIRSLLITS